MNPVVLSNINIRLATVNDLPAIISLLADDMLGQTRERIMASLPACYYEAFNAIQNNAAAELWVVDYQATIIATAQVNYLDTLTHQGSKRAQIEGVRVHSAYRSQGVGQYLLKTIIDRARAKRCRFVQLTTNKKRQAAKRFYEQLGFTASHEGMKLDLLDKTSPTQDLI